MEPCFIFTYENESIVIIITSIDSYLLMHDKDEI